MLEVQDGTPDHHESQCLDGRGAAPPELCGGPRGYRLMLKRQEDGPRVSYPANIGASTKAMAQVYGEDSGIDWELLEEAVTTGWKNVEKRLERSGPLTPTRFSRKEAQERLTLLTHRRRWSR